jgi:hypothetical protein
MSPNVKKRCIKLEVELFVREREEKRLAQQSYSNVLYLMF